MARKSIEKQILDMTADIRLQALGFAAMGVWVTLMNLVRELGLDGSITFGMGRVPALSDVAAIRFRMSVDELKTHLITQSETQLLAWDEATQTLSYGPEQQPSRRTLANRANGAKGGRPRKNSITERTDPAQRHLPPMAIKGGIGMQNPKTHAPIAKLANNDSYKAIAKQEAPSKEAIDALYNQLGPKAFEAAGFDPARDMGNWSAVRQWAADGLAKGMTADEVERLSLAVVSEIAERQRKLGSPVRHMGYFSTVVLPAIAAGNVPPPVLSAADQAAEKAWELAVTEWLRDGAKGPQPALADFAAKAVA